ncbi:hypothetical protein [Gracilibacillus salinarum]|uniref:Uncharacterized protein n=1 Tax=Gracilibacillus salinarum TaxID=2932255 RepID=A0ABY4GNX2_9BACI|nr:hypothetical protein [Gracilibacillus salinarum]UOQ85685.1 hypothetical protein MUN87_01900 [Gracilibacillus salinarum]
MITVTMPIDEYERMKRDLERLKEESIYRYAKRDYSDIKRDEYEITIDVRSIERTIAQKESKAVSFRTI